VQDSKIIQSLQAIVGTDALLTAHQDIAPYLTDHRELYQGRALAVALPRSVDAVAKLLAFCHAQRLGVVPQGGNTSYCGGATPDTSGKQLVIALQKLNRIREVNALNYSLTAEAGCILSQVQQAAAEAERLFPLSLGSEGSCQLGGNLATNAGGTQVLRYGMMRDLVLGLEVVLADGRVMSTLSPLRKDNTGYDVKNLFIGAEGTLGIITAATLKLFPPVRSVATAFIAIPDVQTAISILSDLRTASGDRLSAFELIPRFAVELTTQHIPGIKDPLDETYPWYALCELTSSRAADGLDGILEEALSAALSCGDILGAAIAQNEREREALWKLRETIPEAQRLDGASLKHDISLPVARIAEFLDLAMPWVEQHVPEGRLVAYGHLGDGNLHFNLNQAPQVDRAAFLARTESTRRAVHDLVQQFGGSFSAEHGIGQLKVPELERYATPVELQVMKTLKQALDPLGILNPGKVLKI
jgi:FAD/FMN-containing dehydrogenase